MCSPGSGCSSARLATSSASGLRAQEAPGPPGPRGPRTHLRSRTRTTGACPMAPPADGVGRGRGRACLGSACCHESSLASDTAISTCRPAQPRARSFPLRWMRAWCGCVVCVCRVCVRACVRQIPLASRRSSQKGRACRSRTCTCECAARGGRASVLGERRGPRADQVPAAREREQSWRAAGGGPARDNMRDVRIVMRIVMRIVTMCVPCA